MLSAERIYNHLVNANGLIRVSTAGITLKKLIEATESHDFCCDGLKESARQPTPAEEMVPYRTVKLPTAIKIDITPCSPRDRRHNESHDDSNLWNSSTDLGSLQELSSALRSKSVPSCLRGHVWLTILKIFPTTSVNVSRDNANALKRREALRNEANGTNDLLDPNLYESPLFESRAKYLIKLLANPKYELTCPQLASCYLILYALLHDQPSDREEGPSLASHIASPRSDPSPNHMTYCVYPPAPPGRRERKLNKQRTFVKGHLSSRGIEGIAFVLPALVSLLDPLFCTSIDERIEKRKLWVVLERELGHNPDIDPDRITSHSQTVDELRSGPLKPMSHYGHSAITFEFFSHHDCFPPDLEDQTAFCSEDESGDNVANVDDNPIIREKVIPQYIEGYNRSFDFVGLHHILLLSKKICSFYLLSEYETHTFLTAGVAISAFMDWAFAETIIAQIDDVSLIFRQAFSTLFGTTFSPKILTLHLDHVLTGDSALILLFVINLLHSRYTAGFVKTPVGYNSTTRYEMNMLQSIDELELQQLWTSTHLLAEKLPTGIVKCTIEKMQTLRPEIVIWNMASCFYLTPPASMKMSYDMQLNSLTEIGPCNKRKLFYYTCNCYIDVVDALLMIHPSSSGAKPLLIDLRSYKDQLMTGEICGSTHVDCVNQDGWKFALERLARDARTSNLVNQTPILLVGIGADDPIVEEVFRIIKIGFAISLVCAVRGGYEAFHSILMEDSHPLRPVIVEHDDEICYLCTRRGDDRHPRSADSISRGSSSPPNKVPTTPQRRRVNKAIETKPFTNFDFDTERRRYCKKTLRSRRGASKSSVCRIDVPSVSREGDASDEAILGLNADPLKKKRKNSNNMNFSKFLFNLRPNKSPSFESGDLTELSQSGSSLRGYRECIPVGLTDEGLVHHIDRAKIKGNQRYISLALATYMQIIMKRYPKLIYHRCITSELIQKHAHLIMPAMCEMFIPVLSEKELKSDVFKSVFMIGNRSIIKISDIRGDRLYRIPVWLIITKYMSIIMLLRFDNAKVDKEKSQLLGRNVYYPMEFTGDSKQLCYALYDVPISLIKKAFKIQRKTEPRSLGLTAPLRFVFMGSSDKNYEHYANKNRLIPHRVDSVWEIHTQDETAQEEIIEVLMSFADKVIQHRKKAKKQIRSQHESALQGGFGFDQPQKFTSSESRRDRVSSFSRHSNFSDDECLTPHTAPLRSDLCSSPESKSTIRTTESENDPKDTSFVPEDLIASSDESLLDQT
eukprot:GHVH01000965.1.p1 GENE.GHVH01000965.1~~GHVH01000965.1.p1  ORF type:complete len:1249 (+),score=140.00 GHVH01000965.1:97-3843(+)